MYNSLYSFIYSLQLDSRLTTVALMTDYSLTVDWPLLHCFIVSLFFLNTVWLLIVWMKTVYIWTVDCRPFYWWLHCRPF